MKLNSTFLKYKMAIRITGIVCVLIAGPVGPLAIAQCWQWAVRAGGSTFEFPAAISVGPDGQSAITGEFQGTAIIGNDTLVSTSGRDVFTALIDSNGVVLNAMGGFGDGVSNTGSGVATDLNGNVFITGNFEGTISFGDSSLESSGLGDIFIVKYDPSGNLVWAKRAGGIDNIYVHDIAVDLVGNCYITGEFYNSASFDSQVVNSTIALDVFTAKYDANGNALWAASCGSTSSDWGDGIAVDDQSNVYICGKFQSGFIFNDIVYNTTGNRDGFIAKYDGDGTPLWAKTGGGTANEFFNKIAVDGDGNNIYVTGEFESDTIDVDGITLVNENDASNRRDLLIVKFNGSGDAQWGVSAGSREHDYSNDIAVDDYGDLFITGTFYDTIVFGNTTLFNDGGDFYISKYSSAGTAVWAKRSSSNTAQAGSNSIAVFNNKPIITGDFAAGSAPPKIVFDNDTLISHGSSDLFVAKIGPPCNVGTGTQLPEMNEINLQVFPNPFSDVLNIRNYAHLTGPLVISVFDSQGRLIHSEHFNSIENIILQTDQMPSGIYFLKIKTNGVSQSVKLIKLNK